MSLITPELLTRFDVAGPRYTSYPTADRFVEAFSPSDLRQALDLRTQGLGQKSRPLSIYIHIPFCESLCYYCACNKIITKHHENAQPYLLYLAKEVALYTNAIGLGQSVSQLHFGGGTPTFLSDSELSDLMAMLKGSFSFAAGGEYSVEVDPRTVNADRLQLLFDLGFNRLSFGVQDFDPDVQKAVHRIQPAEQVFDLVASARSIGFESVNVDLIYGLPKQTPDSFDATMKQINVLRPDRIALYAYAHLPERFKPQRRILAAKTMDEYVDMLDQGQLPIVKGLALSRDDQIRRAWIMAIMCQGHVQFDAFNEAWLIDAHTYFSAEFKQLESMQTQGLVELSKQGLQVTPMGWFFVRGVAMVFDKYLQADRYRHRNGNRFSKII
ncbi:MAG: oxygen-independent coproporphyrinogen III oxidase [Comamonadaceae bacterium]|nr:oxygen-independent coproporphyrinogen III oxidase [Comamonadaceae bacterium]